MMGSYADLNRPFIKAGPVYVNGRHVFTARRDIAMGDLMRGDDVVLPDGSVPQFGDDVPREIALIACGAQGFEQEA